MKNFTSIMSNWWSDGASLTFSKIELANLNEAEASKVTKLRQKDFEGALLASYEFKDTPH